QLGARRDITQFPGARIRWLRLQHCSARRLRARQRVASGGDRGLAGPIRPVYSGAARRRPPARGVAMAQSWLLGWLVLLAMPTLAVAAVLMHRRGSAGGVRLRQAAVSALLFGVLGPPLGALLIGVPALLTHDDPEPLVMLLFLLVMSYLPGLVPALLCGACMGLLRPMLGVAEDRKSTRLNSSHVKISYA